MMIKVTKMNFGLVFNLIYEDCYKVAPVHDDRDKYPLFSIIANYKTHDLQELL